MAWPDGDGEQSTRQQFGVLLKFWQVVCSRGNINGADRHHKLVVPPAIAYANRLQVQRKGRLVQ